MKGKRVIAFISSLSFLFASSAQATVYLNDYPHLAEIKSRAEAIFPGAIFRRLYFLSYSREADQFTNISTYLNFYITLSSSASTPLPGEFHLGYFGFGNTIASGGLYCFGFNLLVDYFDQSNFQTRSSFLPILPLFRPKSGCYAMVTLPGLFSNTNTGLKPEVYTSSSSFVSGLAFLAPDNSGVTSELVYETQNNYDKAYFSAQWVNPQCKWIPSHFRHKTNSWSDISNFFSSLFF